MGRGHLLWVVGPPAINASSCLICDAKGYIRRLRCIRAAYSMYHQYYSSYSGPRTDRTSRAPANAMLSPWQMLLVHSRSSEVWQLHHKCVRFEDIGLCARPMWLMKLLQHTYLGASLSRLSFLTSGPRCLGRVFFIVEADSSLSGLTSHLGLLGDSVTAPWGISTLGMLMRWLSLSLRIWSITMSNRTQ